MECTVEVHFKEIIDLVRGHHADILFLICYLQPGPDAYTVVPDSQLIISRVAYSNSTSKYKINGRSTNREEVTTLLKGKGIDLDHNRFLILQVNCFSWALMPFHLSDRHF